MNKQVFVKPAEGLLVRHPEKKKYILPKEGEMVTLNRDWLRLIRYGDVVVVKEQMTSNGGDE